MDTNTLADLEVWYRVGVPDEERAHPQRLTLTVQMVGDFQSAAASDDLQFTINYFAVAQELTQLGDGRSWKLIETLAVEIAERILRNYRPTTVTVEVRKFILPNTRYVSVKVTRPIAIGDCIDACPSTVSRVK